MKVLSFKCQRNGDKTLHLMAGYVKQVAIHFETAPNTKAKNAERASGDDTLSLSFLIFPLSSLCFNWSNTVYCMPSQIIVRICSLR